MERPLNPDQTHGISSGNGTRDALKKNLYTMEIKNGKEKDIGK